jgi:hypothetical protein
MVLDIKKSQYETRGQEMSDKEGFHIVEYDEISAKLDEVEEAANFLPDVTTDEGYNKSKRVSLDVGKLLTALDKKRKEKKAYFLNGGREVDGQAKAIAARLEEIQLPHKSAYKELDNLKKEREANRKAKLEERVQYIRDISELMADSHSSEILAAMNQMQEEECLDFFEYTDQALKARNDSRKSLSSLFDRRRQEEKDAEELEKLRKESEERAVKEREEQIKRESAAKAEAETKAAKEREEIAKQDAIRAEQAKVDAERRAIEAEKTAKENAEKAAEAARVAEVERQKQEEEAKRQEQLKLEANKRHVGNVRRGAKEALMKYVDEATAKKIVIAIHNTEIPSISISY